MSAIYKPAKVPLGHSEPGFLENLPIAAMTFDAHGACTFTTFSGRKLLSVDPLGCGSTVIFADWTSVPDLFVGTGVSETVVSVVRHADGRVFRCEASRVPPIGVFLTLTDISRHVLEANCRFATVSPGWCSARRSRSG